MKMPTSRLAEEWVHDFIAIVHFHRRHCSDSCHVAHPQHPSTFNLREKNA
jgi:L-ascorbate metabolism protein UlaG (beta-lactamase superfamily)